MKDEPVRVNGRVPVANVPGVGFGRFGRRDFSCRTCRTVLGHSGLVDSGRRLSWRILTNPGPNPGVEVSSASTMGYPAVRIPRGLPAAGPESLSHERVSPPGWVFFA